jgi:hypothetical protein
LVGGKKIINWAHLQSEAFGFQRLVSDLDSALQHRDRKDAIVQTEEILSTAEHILHQLGGENA